MYRKLTLLSISTILFIGVSILSFPRIVNADDTWITQRLTHNGGGSAYPQIAVDGLNIYVVWQDNTLGGNPEIYFKRSVDGGASWTTKALTNNAGVSVNPTIAVDGQNIYVVWDDDTSGNSEIYFKKSVDRGVTWKAEKNLSNNEGESGGPVSQWMAQTSMWYGRIAHRVTVRYISRSQVIEALPGQRTKGSQII